MIYLGAKELERELGINEGGDVHKYFTQECFNAMTKYTPGPKGTINMSVDVRIDEIEYKSPYAHYLYNGILMVDPETGSSCAKKGQTKVYTNQSLHYKGEPIRGAYWDQKMWNAEGDQVIAKVQNYIDRH